MCGVLAVINRKIETEQFDKALATLHHRGPDGRGTYSDPETQTTFGHTRLSIIDLSTGGQPLYNEDKSLVLICNGELYGFEAIREDLQKKGHRFSTRSDSEIILHLYAEYGVGLLEHLRGEFAFVLHDRKQGKIIAARDRFGIKPLYFSAVDKGLVFASETKAIFATKLVVPKMDVEVVRNVFCLIRPENIFEGVRSVPAASYLVYDFATASYDIKKYWSLDLPNYDTLKAEKSLEENSREVALKVDDAIRVRLRADVPVGVYLSGGIDSAAIAGTIAKLGKKDLKAFSISFCDDPAFNESSIARKMAESIGAEFHELLVTEDLLVKNFEESLWHTESPCHNLHGVGKFLLSDLAAKHVKVVLTGEGGDEVFLGYDYFKLEGETRLASFGNIQGRNLPRKEGRGFKRHFAAIKKFLGFQVLPEFVELQSKGSLFVLNRLFNKAYRKFLFGRPSLMAMKNSMDASELQGRGDLAQLQCYSIQGVLTPYILNTLGDRQEMAHSLEGRTPLLDHELFALARTIPAQQKVSMQKEKIVFREAMKDRVTPDIYAGKKWPFIAPMIAIEGKTRPLMAKLIETHMSKAAIVKAGLFDYGSIRRLHFYLRLFKRFPEMHAKVNSTLTLVLSLQILHKLFVQRDY